VSVLAKYGYNSPKSPKTKVSTSFMAASFDTYNAGSESQYFGGAIGLGGGASVFSPSTTLIKVY
jgi:hypothetical protein